MDPISILQKYYGYSSFRPGQLESIQSVLAGRDTLAVLPTGGGKSVCFQVPSLILGGTTLVISPLISLMQDQVAQLTRRQIKSTYLNSTLSPTELAERTAQLAAGHWQLVYVAPERLGQTSLLQACQSANIPLLAVDEAHCISQWGHDFRPAYVKIAEFITQLPRRPTIMAVTATATPRVQDEIVTTLQLRSPRRIFTSFRRTNLHLRVFRCQTSWQREFMIAYWLLAKGQWPAIIYVSSQSRGEQLAQFLQRRCQPLRVAAYHAGLPADTRQRLQDQFVAGELEVLVATSAFGMGIDKADVRCVIHFHLPTSLEEYYQEAGRAGRDSQPAECLILDYRPAEKISANMVNTEHPGALASWQALQRYVRTKRCRHRFVLNYFGEPAKMSYCTDCDNCVPSSFATPVADRQLYQQFRALGLPASMCCWLTLLKPQHTEAVQLIPGIGQGWLEKWWQKVQHLCAF